MNEEHLATGERALQALRDRLGAGPARFLLWLAHHGRQIVGPMAKPRIHPKAAELTYWIKALEERGLLRTKAVRVGPIGSGTAFELLPIAWDDPLLGPALAETREWWMEDQAQRRAVEKQEAEEKQRAAEGQRIREEQRRDEWRQQEEFLRAKYGSCPDCGGALSQYIDHLGEHIGCPGCELRPPPPNGGLQVYSMGEELARHERDQEFLKSLGVAWDGEENEHNQQ